MKFYLACFVLLLLNLLANGRNFADINQDTDPAGSDSVSIMQYDQLGTKYRKSNPDTAFFLYYKGLGIAKRSDCQSCLASIYKGLGTLHFFRSAYDSAIYHYNQSLSIATPLNDSVTIGTLLNNIGISYNYKAEYDTAITVLLKAYEVRRALNDEKISSTVNNMGIVYQKMLDWEMALKYYQEAASLKEQYGQKLSLANSLNNIGIALKYLDRYPEAIPYYQKSLQIAEEFGDKYKQAYAHNNLAHAYQVAPGSAHLVEEHFLKSIQLKEELKEPDALINSYTRYAEWLVDNGRRKKASDYVNKAMSIPEKSENNHHSYTIFRSQGTILNKLGRHEEAYKILDMAYEIRVKELNEDRVNKIATLQTEFDTERKEAQIQLLSLENELKETRLTESRNMQLAIGIGSLIVVLVLSLLFIQRSKKLKAEKEAQDLQIDALEKRLSDLDIDPKELSIKAEQLNGQLHTPLSNREMEVLKLSFEEKTNNQIAQELFISVNTVKFHLRNTYGKLGVNNRKEAMAYVIKGT